MSVPPGSTVSVWFSFLLGRYSPIVAAAITPLLASVERPEFDSVAVESAMTVLEACIDDTVVVRLESTVELDLGRAAEISRVDNGGSGELDNDVTLVVL